ncbi:hypothetical protein F5B20DRAFT_591925 [Whalleya microplaca]|nr:hypothetical protein F5B20DRAFT_591925 [Whalleya microplaca]
MSAPSKNTPKTMEELQKCFRLKKKADAEALIKSDYVRECFRKYKNRCMSSGSVQKVLPDWKVVDEYLQDKLATRRVRRGKTLEECITEECYYQPYELLPHVSLFVVTVTDFLKSSKGKQFDVSLQKYSRQDAEFDRTMRVMSLLGFLVKQDRGEIMI